jgi:hypothetical protein
MAYRDQKIQNVAFDDIGGGSDFGGDFDGDLGVDFGGDRFSGGDSFGNEGGDISGAGGDNSNVGGDVSGGKEISGGTGDIPTISDIMDRAAASGSADALPGFTTPTANDTLDDNKSNSSDFPADTATNSTSTNPNDFPTDTGDDDVEELTVTGDRSKDDTSTTRSIAPATTIGGGGDDVPEVTITGKRPTKPDVPEIVITGDRPIVPSETRSIDGGGLAVTPVTTPAVTPAVTPTVTPTTTTPAVTTPPVTTPPVVTPPVVTPPVVTPPTDGPGPGETEEQWRLRMGLTGYGNLTDFDKEVARLKGNMDTGVSTSKGLISANMKPPGG